METKKYVVVVGAAGVAALAAWYLSRRHAANGVVTIEDVPLVLNESGQLEEITVTATRLDPIAVAAHSSNADPQAPRGIRNNNPTNIRAGVGYVGEIGRDKDGYAIFDSPLNGLRAPYLEVWDSITRDHDDTIDTLVRQWAPPSENDTQAYAADVSKRTAIPRTQKLVYSAHATPIVKALVWHENGQNPYGDALYYSAYTAAGKS